MVRSYGKGMLVAALVWPGFGWGQQAPKPAPAPALTSEQYITLQEPGKPEQKCRVLRIWQEKGNLVKEVVELNSGEVMRVVEGGPVGGRPLLKPAPRFPGTISRLFRVNRAEKPSQAFSNSRPTDMVQAGYQPAAAASAPASPSGVRQAAAVAPLASGLVPVRSGEEIIKVREPGKPALRCRVVKSWRTPEGYLARQVQEVVAGETLSVVEVPVQSGGGPNLAPRNAVASLIYHWGASETPPAGAPLPPAVVDAGPVTSVADPDPNTNAAPPPGPGPTDNCAAAAGPCATCPCVPGPCPPCTKPARGGWLANCLRKNKPGPCEACPCPPCTTMAPDSGQTVAAPATSEPAAPVVVSTAPSCGDCCATRVPWWKKLFGGKETDPGRGQTNGLAAASPSPYATSAGAAVSKFSRPSTEVAQPTDWRRSWGKPDTSQALADNSQTQPVPAWPKDFDRNRKPVQPDSVLAPKTPAKPEVKPAVPQSVAVKPAVPQSVAVKSTGLPKAEKRKTDPLDQLERYSKRPEIKHPNPGAVAEATKEVESKYGKRPGAKPASSTAAPKEQPKVAQQPEAPAPIGKAVTTRKPPLGSMSVLAAYEGKPKGSVCFLPVPVVTLPQRIPPAPPGLASSAEAGKAQAVKPDEAQANAFTPPGYGGGKVKDPKSPMANAFTAGIMPNPRPMGYLSRPAMTMPAPMPVSPAGYLPPAARSMSPGMPAAAPVPAYVSQPAPAAPTPQDLMTTLQNGLYPSQRERAAMALAALAGKGHPEVVNALVLAAQEDPAATVRSACVRCLGKMNGSTPGVTTALQGLRDDAHPLVRQAVAEVLGTEVSSKSDAKVQPAAAVAPESEK